MSSKSKKEGLVVVISAPSGGGKTTLCQELLKSQPNLVRSISLTTRPPRSGERNGKDYCFVSKKEFLSLRGKKAFLEWAKVFGQYYYGTSARLVEKTLRRGKDILLIIDVQGARKVKRIYPQGLYIFIMPPSLKVLAQRLKTRALDSNKQIQRRLKVAKKEISHRKFYDYILVNDRLDRVVKKLKAIITAEKIRRV